MPVNNKAIQENRIVGVVVPIYNSEEYLRSCIDSILSQTYENIKLVLVDDGSKDNSWDICNEYAKKDSRIVVLEQENSGPAKARKKGILTLCDTEKALCEYVIFVDSDDTIEPDYIEMLLKKMGDCDLVSSGMIYGDKIITDSVDEGVYVVEKDSPIIKNMIYADDNITQGINTNMCIKLYRTDIALIIAKEPDWGTYYGEDGEFVYKYILKCRKVCVTYYAGYHYTMNNSGSITHSIHPDFLMNVNKLYLSLKYSIEESGFLMELMPQLERWIGYHIRLATEKMGFRNEEKMIRYIIPYKANITGKSVIVYGAGRVGEDYIRQIKKEQLCTNFIWVDKEYDKKTPFLGYHPVSPEIIKNIEYDYVIIAVNNKNIIQNITDELINMGVVRDKILAVRPMYIEEFYS